MLDLDPATILWQTLNFLILTAALYFILYKPLLQRIKEREAEKQRTLERIEEDREDAAELKARMEARLSSAQEKAENIVNHAEEEADEKRQALIEAAQREVERILATAQTDVHRLNQQAVDRFHQELLEAVIGVSGTVISQAAPDELQEYLIEQLSEKVWELGDRDMQRVEALRRSLGDRTPTVHVRSARPLTPEQQQRVATTLAALADRDVDIEVEVHEELGLGLQVRLGDLMLDNTIRGRLDDMYDDVREALEEQVIHE